MLNVQDAKVPANLLTLPVHIFEDQENQWLLDLRAKAKGFMADPLLEGVEVDPVFVDGDAAKEIDAAKKDAHDRPEAYYNDAILTQ